MDMNSSIHMVVMKIKWLNMCKIPSSVSGVYLFNNVGIKRVEDVFSILEL